MLPIQYLHRPPIKILSPFARTTYAHHAKLAEFRQRADQMKHHALMRRAVVMQPVQHGQIHEIEWRQPKDCDLFGHAGALVRNPKGAIAATHDPRSDGGPAGL